MTGRIFAEEMSKVLNTPIAPINKGGATGSLAATSMLSAAKDGYSILVNTLGGMVLAPVTLKGGASLHDKTNGAEQFDRSASGRRNARDRLLR